MGSRTFDGVSFFVYVKDHEPPHVHGFSENVQVIVALLPGGEVGLAEREDAISPRNAKQSTVRKIQRVAAQNVDELVALWRKYMAHGDVVTTEAQLDAAYERAKKFDRHPRVESIEYAAAVDAFILYLSSKHRYVIPREQLRGLEAATTEQLAKIEVHGGLGLSWPDLDVDYYFPYILAERAGGENYMHEEEVPASEQSAVAA